MQLSGLRYYNPEMGRWASRDPVGKRGGMNLYGFLHNMPIGRFDKLGLYGCSACKKPEPGSKCCPACEVDALKDLLQEGEKALKDAMNGILPTGGETLGSTVCTPPIFGSHGNATMSFNVDIETCLGFCVHEHEMMHKIDCEGRWEPGNPYYDIHMEPDPEEKDKLKAKTEATAYGRSNSCLKNQIKKAEAAIQKHGSADAACECCKSGKGL